MATSGTFNFSPSVGEVVLYAYNRCGIRSPALVQEHFEAARMASNMICLDWTNRGVNLWQVELVTVPLVQGVTTYTVDPSVILILDGYVTVTNAGVTTDRIILPISRTEYASYPRKEQQGFPTTYWMDRLLQPTVTLWPVPNGQQTSFSYYALQQSQDVAYTNGQNLAVPAVWLKAFADALAVELAVIWAPQTLAYLAPMADKSYQLAAEQNEESASVYVSPMVSGYWRA